MTIDELRKSVIKLVADKYKCTIYEDAPEYLKYSYVLRVTFTSHSCSIDVSHNAPTIDLSKHKLDNPLVGRLDWYTVTTLDIPLDDDLLNLRSACIDSTESKLVADSVAYFDGLDDYYEVTFTIYSDEIDYEMEVLISRDRVTAVGDTGLSIDSDKLVIHGDYNVHKFEWSAIHTNDSYIEFNYYKYDIKSKRNADIHSTNND